MSYERIIKAVNVDNFGSIAQSETLDHPDYVKKITGIDPFENPQEAFLRAIKKLDIDWVASVPKRANKFAEGETKKETENGYITQWGFTGSYWSHRDEFHDIEDVYNHDPFKKYDSEEQLRDNIRAIIKGVLDDQSLLNGAAVVSGLHYTTLFMWFVVTFGWESFMTAAASDPDRFEVCLERYTRLSCIYAEEYAVSKLPFFFCHDDLALTRGLVFAPEWYRKYIFPAYERIFEPFKKAGKKIVFVSDGNFSVLIDDLFAVGVDGLMVDWTIDLEKLLKKYGQKKLIAGNADTAILTFGTREDVRKEVLRCINAGRDAGGYVLKCSNDMPHNIPLENIEEYFNTVAEYNAGKSV